MSMPLELYNNIVDDIKNYRGNSHDCEKFIRDKYKQIPPGTLASIISMIYQRLMKKNYRKSPAISKKYYESYKEMCKIEEKRKLMLKLSEKYGFTPALFARSMLQHVYPNSNTLRKCLVDTTVIDDNDLAMDVYSAIIYDNQYGSITDVVKRVYGKEYELRLERELRLLNISFSDEEILRRKGYDKTPDFKLDVPIAVDGFIVNWVESKALFGDEENHSGYLKEQLMCYWNRFGPGLLIYWCGYVETIEKTPEVNNMFILRDSFPPRESITLYNIDDDVNQL